MKLYEVRCSGALERANNPKLARGRVKGAKALKKLLAIWSFTTFCRVAHIEESAQPF